MSDTQHLIKKLSVISLCIGLAGCGGGGSTTTTNQNSVDVAAPVSDWSLVWSDEFDGSAVDTNKWTINVDCNGGGNAEKQCYSDDAANVFVSDGTLRLVAMPAEEGAALPYTSGKIDSKMKGDFKYGRFEMRAKLPSGQGSWPAFWMLPTDEVYGGWPHSGEIDIVESVNLKTVADDGTVESHVYGTLHYGYSWPDNQRSGAAYQMSEANPADDFHIYAFEWQEGEMRWYIDGYLYQTQLASETRVNSKGEVVGLAHQGWFAEYFDQGSGEPIIDYKAPYEQTFYMLLNNAVGGNWPENVNDLGVDADAFAATQTFEVDYVRVYECAINPQTGAGCETVRAGYKEEKSDERPDGALVLGKAPVPALPGSGDTPATNLVLFVDEQNSDWPIWDCCGGSTPTVETDDAEHGAVVEFVIGAAPTVMGFLANEGVTYDGSGMVDSGTVEFDMKVVTSPGPDTGWKFKIESLGAATAVELDLTESLEGQAVETGVWQHYTFKVSDLAEAGLDVSAINVLMIFPAWGTGEGAVYRVDNMQISQPNAGSGPSVVLFDEGSNIDWPMWDCCGGSTPVEVVDDAVHNVVAEFSIGSAPTVMGFLAAEGKEFDASAIVANGTVAFDLKMVSAPGPDSVWKFKIESVGASTAVELDLSASVEGHVPVLDQWQRYTFKISDLAAAGLDVSAINVVMIFPAWGTGEGAVYRVDNAAISAPSASAGPELIVYDNAVNPQWPSWDCCGGSTPTEQTDEDAAHGQVTEFSIGASPTVMGFLAAEGAEFDASAITANGVVEFDLKVMTSPGPDTAWKFKIESVGAATAVELDFTDSSEGAAPVTGQWQHYTYKLADLAAAGLDVSAINVMMMFPAWGTGEGAVYRVDNVRVGD